MCYVIVAPYNLFPSHQQVERLLRIELDYLESLVEGPPGTMERDLNEYMYVTFRDNIMHMYIYVKIRLLG